MPAKFTIQFSQGQAKPGTNSRVESPQQKATCRASPDNRDQAFQSKTISSTLQRTMMEPQVAARLLTLKSMATCSQETGQTVSLWLRESSPTKERAAMAVKE
jgi:hypothetical protein